MNADPTILDSESHVTSFSAPGPENISVIEEYGRMIKYFEETKTPEAASKMEFIVRVFNTLNIPLSEKLPPNIKNSTVTVHSFPKANKLGRPKIKKNRKNK